MENMRMSRARVFELLTTKIGAYGDCFGLAYFAWGIGSAHDGLGS